MSSTAIPTSTSVAESAVINAPLSHVWHHIKLHHFADFWSRLSKSEAVKGTSEEADVVKWTFKDGTVLDVKLEEHSVRGQFLLRSSPGPSSPRSLPNPETICLVEYGMRYSIAY